MISPSLCGLASEEFSALFGEYAQKVYTEAQAAGDIIALFRKLAIGHTA
jgi:hypothetical protein